MPGASTGENPPNHIKADNPQVEEVEEDVEEEKK